MEHKCGIIGIIGENIIEPLISGLNKLQHRGYESAGITYINNGNMELFKNVGLVEDVFKNFNKNVLSNVGIGHVRYSTTKKDEYKLLEECQPFSNSEFGIAHNGNIPFIQKIKEYYKMECGNNSDTYILMKFMELIKEKYNDMGELLKYIIHTVTGSYALIVITKNKIYALRDRYGIRPLTIMRSKLDKTLCVASETIAVDKNVYDTIRTINPGEIITIDHQLEFDTIYQYSDTIPNFCSFEYIYFMHHQSVHENIHVELTRYKLGYELGLMESHILNHNVVIPIPNSSIPSASGFADAIDSNIKQYIVKNESSKRTFILPTENERKIACSKKFNFVNCDELANKNIYLIDDSIVRGTTIKYVIEQLKKFNPKTINVRIPSPPVVGACYYGIDMSTTNELIINNKDINSIENELGITSLGYLSVDLMKNVFGHQVCTSCFTGKYNKELLDW